MFSCLWLPTNFIIFSSESREYNKIENINYIEIHYLILYLGQPLPTHQATMSRMPSPVFTGYLPGLGEDDPTKQEEYEKNRAIYRAQMAAYQAAQAVQAAQAAAAEAAAAQAAAAQAAAQAAIINEPRPTRENRQPPSRLDL